MGIILGWLCLITFIGLLGKIITRKLNLKKANSFFMRIHKPLSVAFFVLCLVHILFVLSVFQTRSLSIYISGAGIILAALLLILFCHVITGNKKHNLFWHRFFCAAMFLLLIGHMVLYQIDFNAYRDKMKQIQIEKVKLSDISDGTYLGECDAGYIYAKVEVTVSNGCIAQIELLEHKNERGKPAEKIINAILGKQSLEVDAVSGATNSSMVIKKAVENALRSEAK